MHVSNLQQAAPFTTRDRSQIRELAGPVSIPASNQSLAAATLTNTGDVPIRLVCCCAPPSSDADTVLTGG